MEFSFPYELLSESNDSLSCRIAESLEGNTAAIYGTLDPQLEYQTAADELRLVLRPWELQLASCEQKKRVALISLLAEGVVLLPPQLGGDSVIARFEREHFDAKQLGQEVAQERFRWHDASTKSTMEHEVKKGALEVGNQDLKVPAEGTVKSIQTVRSLQELNLAIAMDGRDSRRWRELHLSTLRTILVSAAKLTFEPHEVGQLFAEQLTTALKQLNARPVCSNCRQPATSLNFSKVGNYAEWRWRFGHRTGGASTKHGPKDDEDRIMKNGSPWFPTTRVLLISDDAGAGAEIGGSEN